MQNTADYYNIITLLLFYIYLVNNSNFDWGASDFSRLSLQLNDTWATHIPFTKAIALSVPAFYIVLCQKVRMIISAKMDDLPDKEVQRDQSNKEPFIFKENIFSNA